MRDTFKTTILILSLCTIARSQDAAFVVDADLLHRVELVLGELKGDLEYNVQFSDGTTVVFPRAQNIIDQPNSRVRRIISIISGMEGKNGHPAYLTMRQNASPAIRLMAT
jgi:hypothetical protein